MSKSWPASLKSSWHLERRSSMGSQLKHYQMSSCYVLFCILSFEASSSSIYSPSLARVVLVGSARQAGSHNNTRPLHCVLCCLLALCAAACLGNSADLEKNGRWTNFTSILISSSSQVRELIVSSSPFQST